MRRINKTFSAMLAIAGGAALFGAVPALADNCVPGAAWTYTGTAKGKPFISVSGDTTLIEFSPAGKSQAEAIVFSSVNPADAGTYQVNADVDVNHLADDAAFELDGATSAATGRSFETKLASGDGGSSGFSRPINTTAQPFTVSLKTSAKGKVSVKIRNYVVCKLR